MTNNPRLIDNIRKAASEYGERSVENMKLCGRLGREIIRAFDHYLTIDGDVAIGVRPFNEWNPNLGDAHDAAFSYYHDGMLNVGDVKFGIGIRIDHLRDDGHFWLRIVLALRKQGERIAVFVGDSPDEHPIWIGLNYGQDELQRICEKLYAVVLRVFEEDVNLFVHGKGNLMTVGFHPPQSTEKA